MATTTGTLTPEQWQELLTLPADGKTYNVPGVAFRAKHLPRTSMKCEQVIAETQYGTLRRIHNGRKWLATDHIERF